VSVASARQTGVNDFTNTVRIGRGSAVFALGAPREAEFGLRIDW